MPVGCHYHLWQVYLTCLWSTAAGDYVLVFQHPGSRDGRLPSVPAVQVSILDRTSLSNSWTAPNNVIVVNVNEREVRYRTLSLMRRPVDAATSFSVFWEPWKVCLLTSEYTSMCKRTVGVFRVKPPLMICGSACRGKITQPDLFMWYKQARIV